MTTDPQFALEMFEFDTPSVDEQGEVVAVATHSVQRFMEQLGASLHMALVLVPAGRFLMGSPPGQGFPDERPQHAVTVAAFYMGQGPVTQAQWVAVMGNPAPCRHAGPHRPLENVSFHDARAFCERLSALTGRGYILPSEAQWEYACRAGTITPFPFGETLTSALANYVGEVRYRQEPGGVYRHTTTDVGSFPPNAFGLWDMNGNVWEWCADAWHDDYAGAPGDGSAWLEGSEHWRVARGGSWHDGPDLCRSAARLRLAAGEGDDFFGFRVALAMVE